MREKLLGSRALERAVGLERKVLAREAASFPEQADVRGSIARRERDMWRKRWCGQSRRDGRSKLGGAYRIRVEVMSQFKPQVPGPLRHHLPALLSPG
jgi:hypothetical protein